MNALKMIARLFRDDRGDDLIEYAMLTVLIGLVGVAAFDWLHQAMFNAYSSWDTAQQNLWIMPNPAPHP